MSLESEPGRGSCFSFTLPRGTATAEPPTVSRGVCAPDEDEAQKPLILVVDDEVAARELMTNYLEPQYRVALAGTGAEAVSKAQRLLPDAITLDILMPGRGGFDTLAALRSTPGTTGIPVIIVSIIDQKKIGFALGATDYLVKPIQKPILLETLRGHLLSQNGLEGPILLVDDDPKNLELVEATLRSAGYETHGVRSGALALNVLTSLPVRAVLLDLLMPGMDGFEVIRHVRQQPGATELPILVMTAKDLTREERLLLSRSTQGVFQKQGSWQEQLVAEVGRVIHSPALTVAGGQSL